jgi:hypothetical protein
MAIADADSEDYADETQLAAEREEEVDLANVDSDVEGSHAMADEYSKGGEPAGEMNQNGDSFKKVDIEAAVGADEYTEAQFKPKNWELRKAIDLFNIRVTKSAYKALYDSELDCVMSDVDFEEDFCPPDVDEPYSAAVRFAKLNVKKQGALHQHKEVVIPPPKKTSADGSGEVAVIPVDGHEDATVEDPKHHHSIKAEEKAHEDYGKWHWDEATEQWFFWAEKTDLQQQREYQRWERAHFIRKRSPRKCCCYALILIYVLGALFWYVASKFILHPYSFGELKIQEFPHAWSNYTVSQVKKDKSPHYHEFDPDHVLHYRPGGWQGNKDRNRTHCEVAPENENDLANDFRWKDTKSCYDFKQSCQRINNFMVESIRCFYANITTWKRYNLETVYHTPERYWDVEKFPSPSHQYRAELTRTGENQLVDTVYVFFHGSGNTLSGSDNVVKETFKRIWGVLEPKYTIGYMQTYPSYRGNLLKMNHMSGSVDLFQEGGRFIAQAANDFPDAKRLIVHGASLGTAMIMGMIHWMPNDDKKKITHLILEAPFRNGQDLWMRKSNYLYAPWFPFGPVWEDTMSYLENFAEFRNRTRPQSLWIRVVTKELDELVGREDGDDMAAVVDKLLPETHAKGTHNSSALVHKGSLHAKMLCRALESRVDYGLYKEFMLRKAPRGIGQDWN